MARQKTKTDTIGVRVPPKMRYALDLIARKRGASLSSLMVDAAEKLIESEGMTVIRPGDKASLLDTLWSESEDGRLLALLRYAPTLLTHPERVMADTLEHIALQRKFEEYESDDDSPDGPARRLAWQICMNNLDWDLLSPSINDTFADEFLKLGGEFENTKALKDAVRATRAEIGQNTDRENP
jgi:uncharacterized protein (DUF1778 family)